MNNIVKFQEKELNTYGLNGQVALSSVDLANGLGYADDGTVNRIFNRHADEFTPDMSQVVNLTTKGKVRVFSLRGCHLLAMFSKTPVAKEFRRWVLDLIEQQNRTVSKMEIVPAPFDMKAIGGLVKKCCAVAVREEIAKLLENPDKTENWELSDGDMIYYLHNWHCTRNKADIVKMRELIQQNEEYKRRLSAIKQAVA